MKKVAFLIDGYFFWKRIKEITKLELEPQEFCTFLSKVVKTHLAENEELYRIYYYDCKPLANYTSREALFEELENYELLIVRYGTLKKQRDSNEKKPL